MLKEALARRYLTLSGFVAALPVIFAGFVNYIVDPFQYFRKSTPVRFSDLMQRHQLPGIVRNYTFDSIIVGDSLTSLFRNSMFNRSDQPPRQVMNLSLWGSYLRENANAATLALKTKQIKNVYWAIGLQAILNDYKYDNYPSCMYHSDVRSLFPICYLLNMDTLLESAAITLNMSSLSKADWVSSLEKWRSYGHLDMNKETLACEMQKAVKKDDVLVFTNRAADASVPKASSELEKFRSVVLPIVQSYRNTHFDFFFAPLYLSGFWKNAVIGGVLNSERAIIKLLINEPNVAIHDLTGLSVVTHDISRYRDTEHSDAKSAEASVDAILSGSMKITSIEQHEKMLREQLSDGADLILDMFKTNCSTHKGSRKVEIGRR